MSTKTSRRNAVTKNSAIVTRNKSQQTRQLRTKGKKTEKIEKPVSPKQTIEKPEKSSKTETVSKGTPLRDKVQQLVKLVEQVEYYPDKLKRDLSIKKIMLKPKHNFTVVASTNKRKLGVPQRGAQPSQKKPCIAPELSMADMVRLIEENHSLSDEDFMEILTCPSPVWWEDPPDDRYCEEAICRLPQPSPITISDTDSSKTEESEQTTKQQTTTRTKLNKTKTKNTSTDKVKTMPLKQDLKVKPMIVKSERFNIKRQKLENVLGNIKTVKSNVEAPKTVTSVVQNKKRTLSTSTDGEDMSDLSFNEEEVLKHLENIEIPIEQPEEQKTETLRIVKTESLLESREVVVPDVLPPLTRKPDIKTDKESENSDCNTDYSLDSISQSNIRFISDDDISLAESNKDDKINIIDSSSLGDNSSLEETNVQTGTINDTTKKANTDLTEYITVYKIMSNDHEKIAPQKTTDKKKMENVRGKLNSFFKKCKSNKRLKKSTDSSFPATTLTDVNMKKGSICDENRLKDCDYCVVTIENGVTNFSCDNCKKETVFACDLCNFHSNTKETFTKHVSSCKDVARISWNRNYLINQT